MKAMGLFCLFCLLGVPAVADTQTVPNPAQPTEPDIVLPQVVMEIEDLSVENVEATLPPEQELLPPERQLPPPALTEVPVVDPSISNVIASAPTGSGAPGGTAAAGTPGPGLSAEAQLGGGLENTVLGSLSMKTLGPDPQLSLSFTHEGVDGFPDHQPGSGYSLRHEDLSGDLAAALGPVAVHTDGGYHEDENGLQGQSPYSDMLTRELTAGVDLSAKPLGWLSLGASTSGGVDTVALTAASPYSLSEYTASAQADATARFSPVSLTLSGSYDYRLNQFPAASPDLQRFNAGLAVGWDLPASLLLEGHAAWFWDSQGLSLIPFELRFSGSPLDFLTFSLGGGYEVNPLNASDVLSQYAWVLPVPGTLLDDSGWFADSSVEVSLVSNLKLSGKLSYLGSSEMPDASPEQVAATGLYDLTQRAAQRLSSVVGVNWAPLHGISLGVNWNAEWLDRAAFTPSTTLAPKESS